MTITRKEVFDQIQQEFPNYEIHFINRDRTKVSVLIYREKKLIAWFCIIKINKAGCFSKKVIAEELLDIKYIFSREIKENLKSE